MSGIYYGYMTESQREDFIIESTLENEFNKLQMLFEMRCMQYEQNCRDAELKVLSEGGTYDDLAYLIGVATMEAQEQGEGIIAKMINWIKTQWSKLTAKIKKILGLGNPDEQIEVPQEEFNAIKNFANKCNELSSVGSDISAGRFGEAAGKIAKVAGIAIGVAGAGVAGVTMVKVARGDCQAVAKILENIKTNVIQPIINLIEGFQNGLKSESVTITEGNENKAETTSTTTSSDGHLTDQKATNQAPAQTSSENMQKTKDKKSLLDKAKELLNKVISSINKLEAWCVRNVQKEDQSTQSEQSNTNTSNNAQDQVTPEKQQKADNTAKPNDEPEQKASTPKKGSDSIIEKLGFDKQSTGWIRGNINGYSYLINSDATEIQMRVPANVDKNPKNNMREVKDINAIQHEDVKRLINHIRTEVKNEQAAAERKAKDEARAQKKADRNARKEAKNQYKAEQQAKAATDAEAARNAKAFGESTEENEIIEEATLDISVIREMLGEGFIVECTEDSLLIYTESAPDVTMENTDPEISREHSIFGSSVEFDTAMESVEEKSEEFNRLAALIDSL